MKESLVQKLYRPVDARPLEVFRVLFGLILALQFYTYWSSDFINLGILQPVVLFTYDWFPFIKPLPAGLMKVVLAVTFIAPLLMALNRLFRVAVVMYLLCFSYLFLLEESYYNNHFYFIILLTGFFLFYRPLTQGDKKVVPYWLLFLFQFQVVVVYFYGGITKLNYDWLVDQQPVRALLSINAAGSPFPSLTSSTFAVYFLAYGGLAFDLAIGFLLWYRHTFRIAVILTIVFHVTNFWIFNFGEGGTIGIFPLMMLGANVLFARPEGLAKLQGRLTPVKAGKKAGTKNRDAVPPGKGLAVPVLLGIFVGIQLLVPLRHALVPGHVDWTGQQQWFAWRMKVSSKLTSANFILRRYEDDQPVVVELNRLINTMQVNMMAQHTDMIYKFVQYLKKDLKERVGIDNAIINADIKVSFNGRPAQYFVDPNQDLFDIEYHPCGRNDWILDLKE